MARDSHHQQWTPTGTCAGPSEQRGTRRAQRRSCNNLPQPPSHISVKTLKQRPENILEATETVVYISQRRRSNTGTPRTYRLNLPRPSQFEFLRSSIKVGRGRERRSGEKETQKKEITLVIKGKDVGHHSVNECRVLLGDH